MNVQNTKEGWGWPARLLHWVMAALILIMLGVGVKMVNFEPDLIARFELTQLHKSVGALILVLAVIRLIWRLLNRAVPAMPKRTPAWQVRAARTSHLTFYVLILALPISGWLMASASPLNDVDAVPFQIRNMVFGLFEMPDPFPRGNDTLRRVFLIIHAGLATVLSLQIVVHVVASLRHHFVDRDNVLVRMVRSL